MAQRPAKIHWTVTLERSFARLAKLSKRPSLYSTRLCAAAAPNPDSSRQRAALPALQPFKRTTARWQVGGPPSKDPDCNCPASHNSTLCPYIDSPQADTANVAKYLNALSTRSRYERDGSPQSCINILGRGLSTACLGWKESCMSAKSAAWLSRISQYMPNSGVRCNGAAAS